MSKELLARLDRAIEDTKSREAEARTKATERRDALAKDGAPEVGTDEFKAQTDELSGFYREADESADKLTELKSQRATLARSAGVAIEPEEGKGAGDFDLTQAVRDIADGKFARQGGKAVDYAARITDGAGYKSLDADGYFREGVKGVGGQKALGEFLTKSEFKALISRASNSAGAWIDAAGPQILGPETILQQPIDILPYLTTIDVSTDSVKYVVELLASHNVKIVPDPVTAEPIGSGSPAVTEAQAGLKPESAYTYGSKTADIETLAHFLPIHKNQLADVPQLRAILEAQMKFGLQLFLQSEVIAGDGSEGHLRGVLNTTGIVSQPKGSDPMVDALHKATTGIRIGFNEPSAYAMHPTNWEQIRLAKDANGNYYFGPPAMAGATTLWGKPVIVSSAVPLNRPIVGDWRFAELYLREGISLIASDSHADFFRRNLIALLAEMRAGFGVRRPAAFGTVTGIS